MLLTLDLGNTSLFIGVCDDGKVIDTYRTSTNIHKSSDEYVIIFKDLLGDYINKIDGVICSSVVPCLNYTIKEAIKNGANTIDEVSKTTGACTGSCHGFRCKSKIQNLINDYSK